MNSDSAVQSVPRDWITRGLYIVLLAAVAAGLYARFAGLGKWSLGVDEYYISRSIDNILRTGLPRFSCGGFYIRGLTYQYAVAAVRLSALSPEFSARLVSALSSLIGLPAAFLIGRRLHSRAAGLLLVIVLSVSVWEIEMARFARMYAPFQSVFLWYLVYFLRYAVDRNRTSLIPMVLLSVLGVLTWEGGALLGVTNLLPPLLHHERGRLRRSDWPYLGVMLLLLGALVSATTDLRGSPPLPVVATAPAAASVLVSMTGVYLRHLPWMIAFLALLLATVVRCLPWLWSVRDRWLAAVGLLLTLVAALLHQFWLCGTTFVILLLTGLLQPEELRQPAARSYLLTLAACAVFWTAFGTVTAAWTDTTSGPTLLSGRWLGLMEHLSGYPEVFGQILRPWARTMPALTLGALLLSGALTVWTILQPPARSRIPRALLIVLLVVMLAIGMTHPARIETRYTFFLYPLVAALSLTAILCLAELIVQQPRAALAFGAILSLLCFGLSEDFQPRHIEKIDSRRIVFRMGMSPVLADHYYPRADYRVVADWLGKHVHPGDIVMIGIPTIDQYYHRANFVFLQDNDSRYDDYACSSGATERWTNLPLLNSANELAPRVAAGHRIFLLLYPDQAPSMLAEGARRKWHQQLAWTAPDGAASAILINPH